MLAVLHLHDNLLAAVRLAEYVVDRRLVTVEERRLLLVEERQVGDAALADKQRVQEVNQSGLGELLSKNDFESDVCKWVDELSHNRNSRLFVFTATKLRKKAERAKLSAGKSSTKNMFR